MLGDQETLNEQGEIIALEVENDEGEANVKCNSMGVLGLTDVIYRE